MLPLFLFLPWALAGYASDLTPPPAGRDSPPDSVLPAPGQSDEDELARLRALPAHRVPLKNATLASAIRLLAEDAGLSYLAPPESEFSERITSDVMMNPYEMLRLLSEDYNFGLEYHRGAWRFYRVNLNELVTKTYTLRYNNLQHVSITQSSINNQLAAFSGGGGSSVSGPTGSNSGSTRGGGSGGTFDAKTDRIIEDVKKILGIPTVGLNTPSLEGSPEAPGAAAARKGLEAPKIEPIWNPDTSQLFVVATRQQHSLIAAYLKTVDQPQKLIRVAVKFVETSRNPSNTVGVDWSQTFLGSGGPITLAGGAISSSASSVSNAGTTTTTTTSGGGSTTTTTGGTTGSTGTSNPLAVAINLAHPGSVALPISLLSAPAMQWTVQAIAQDVNSTVVQDPVLYTSNNREVTFKATTEQPIQEGSTTFGSATTATSSQIAYIEVGTELTVLPSVLPGSDPKKQIVLLSLSINVSTIIGQQVINGNPYPITSTRTYSYSVPIPSGETLAIAGLEQRTHQSTENKVPLLGDIPLLGYAFKSHNDLIVHTTLLAFITPEVIAETPGEGAEVADLPQFHHRFFAGSGSETMAEIDRSLDHLPEDIAVLRAAATPDNKDLVLNRLDQIGVELALIDIRLGELRLTANRVTKPEVNRVSADRDRLTIARDRVARISIDPSHVSGP